MSTENAYWDSITAASNATNAKATPTAAPATTVGGWADVGQIDSPSSSGSMGLSSSGVTGALSGDTVKGLGMAGTVAGLAGSATQNRSLGMAGGILGTASTLGNANVSTTDKALSVGQLAAGLTGNQALGLGLGGWSAYAKEGAVGVGKMGVSTALGYAVPGLGFVSAVSGLLGGPTVGGLVGKAFDAVDDAGGFSQAARDTASFNADVAAISGINPGFGVADARALGPATNDGMTASVTGDPDGSFAAAEAGRLGSHAQDNAVGGWSSGSSDGGYGGPGTGDGNSAGANGGGGGAGPGNDRD